MAYLTNMPLFALIYEANMINNVAVQAPHGISRRVQFEDIVMQGEVLAPCFPASMLSRIVSEHKFLTYF